MLASHDELELFERSQLGTLSLFLHNQIFNHPLARKGEVMADKGDVQIGSLCCESAEEAKTLIPSLANKISDIDLQELLDDISKLRNFVE